MTSSVSERDVSKPDGLLVSVGRAAVIAGEAARTFNRRYDETRDVWVFRVAGREVLVPNIPAGKRRRVPKARLLEAINGTPE